MATLGNNIAAHTVNIDEHQVAADGAKVLWQVLQYFIDESRTASHEIKDNKIVKKSITIQTINRS